MPAVAVAIRQPAERPEENRANIRLCWEGPHPMAKDHGIISRRMKELRVPQKQIAEALGVTKSSVSRKLSGQLPLRGPELVIVANMLKIDVRDLIRALGHDDEAPARMAITHRLIDDGTLEELPAEDQEKLVTQRPEGLINGTAALIGTSALQPRYRRGEIVFSSQDGSTDPADYIGIDCIVTLADGRQLLALVQQGSQPGRVSLTIAATQELIIDAPTTAAAPIIWHRAAMR